MAFPTWVIHYRYFIVIGLMLALIYALAYGPLYFEKTRPKPEPRHPQEDHDDHTEIV